MKIVIEPCPACGDMPGIRYDHVPGGATRATVHCPCGGSPDAVYEGAAERMVIVMRATPAPERTEECEYDGDDTGDVQPRA